MTSDQINDNYSLVGQKVAGSGIYSRDLRADIVSGGVNYVKRGSIVYFLILKAVYVLMFNC